MTSTDKATDAALIKAIKASLPLRFEVTKHAGNVRSKDGKRLTRNGQQLSATDVLDSGSVGGITLVAEVHDEVLALSLTAVRIHPQHPLYKDIRAYQRRRREWLATQPA